MAGVKRDDIWLVDLNPTKGSEQKTKPNADIVNQTVFGHISNINISIWRYIGHIIYHGK